MLKEVLRLARNIYDRPILLSFTSVAFVVPTVVGLNVSQTFHGEFTMLAFLSCFAHRACGRRKGFGFFGCNVVQTMTL